MHSLRRLLSFSPSRLRLPPPFSSSSPATCLSREVAVLGRRPFSTRPPSSPSAATGDDEWNDAWETAWLPEDPSTRDRAPWEPDPTSPSAAATSLPSDIDADTKAFVAEMDERWSERRAAKKLQQGDTALERVEKNSKKAGDDYRVRKQRIHAGLWMKEIEKMEEVKLGGSNPNDDIDRLLDSCSEIFDAGNIDLNDSKIPSTSEFKTKPDGWETTSRSQDGNIWEISQREEDILLQEFERRIAFYCQLHQESHI
ncbi:protein GAMETE CELL DEFECTIVE 1, mitochondrial isoform X2 [Elaeis guineensis]|uniref:protein GAMETE CELL DEFECTIVE 1, mitochondrial isoform X2 n=1 Tax=Elaeis guineensis var. tenera TaxID=51953 RepID=UPI00057B25CA